jgi:hypothetical protein
VDVFQDQSSGADLHRPGLDSLLDLVADGGVDIVLAQDADLGEGLNIGFGTM